MSPIDWYVFKLVEVWEVYRKSGFIAALYTEFIVTWIFFHTIFSMLAVATLFIFDYKRFRRWGYISYKTKRFLHRKKIFKIYRAFLRKFIKDNNKLIHNLFFYAGVLSFFFTSFIWFYVPFIITGSFDSDTFFLIMARYSALVYMRWLKPSLFLSREFQFLNDIYYAYYLNRSVYIIFSYLFIFNYVPYIPGFVFLQLISQTIIVNTINLFFMSFISISTCNKIVRIGLKFSFFLDLFSLFHFLFISEWF